ncbi:MAG TPA: nuclear transport factor 2 family protein [Streptosporangiaceae bacterium]|nr:nuclear transport factor 2 family protein [Streptosporangiaceae bacterium]
MTEQPNVVRIKDGYIAFANGDFAALSNLLAEDVVWHFGGRNQISGDYRGRDAVYAGLAVAAGARPRQNPYLFRPRQRRDRCGSAGGGCGSCPGRVVLVTIVAPPGSLATV